MSLQEMRAFYFSCDGCQSVTQASSDMIVKAARAAIAEGWSIETVVVDSATGYLSYCPRCRSRAGTEQA